MKATAKVVWLAVTLLVLTTPVAVLAQTSTSAYVTGNVFDPTQAVVPNANVEYLNTATGTSFKTKTNEAGLYAFTTLPPATYKVSVTAQGFRTSVIPSVRVEVNKSYTIDVTLEVGAMAETIEVTAGAGIELQTSDAAVGTVYGGTSMLSLPNPSRSITSLLLLQPLVSPGRGVSSDIGGSVSGARSDQSTFLLDGGDVTSDTEGTGGYNSGFDGAPQAVIPTPAESIEEFRVSTTNPNATFSRSEGGQIAMITKRGTNDLHGTVYWYHKNDELEANGYDRNAAGISKPEALQNRFGFSVGGPVWKDWTWLYGNYEGRRLPLSGTVTRAVPSATFRDGHIIDPVSGTDYNFNPADGPIHPTDPRGIGISPVIRSLLNLYPAGNAGSAGGADGVNTIGFRGTYSRPLNDEFVVVRWDQKITDKWNFWASYRYSRTEAVGTQQVDIANITGCGGVCSTRRNPLQPRYIVTGVTGQITPTLTSQTTFSWYRHWWAWQTTAPFPQVSGTDAALDIGQEGATGTISDLMNIDTQNARSRTWNGKDSFVAENMTWVKGKHTIQFGGDYRRQQIYHQRTDKVTGGLASGPIFYLESGNFINMQGFRPAGIWSNSRWDTYFVSMMGLLDRSAWIQTRDGELNPLPLGTAAEADSRIEAYQFYAQDVWHFSPSVTITFGVTYGIQVPPVEKLGRQMVMVFRDVGEPVFLDQYFRRVATAAASGSIYNPEIAYSPIGSVEGLKYVTDIDWDNFGPRLAVAWNPAYENWFWGNRKTVIRGGWSRTFTRKNGVGLIMTPLLGVGLQEILSCRGPITPFVNAATSCVASSTPANAFRIGPDGSGVPFPAAGPAQIPFPVSGGVPGVGRVFGETRSFMIDPGYRLGRSDSFDVTWQRELPHDMILEVGYVGRRGRNLQQSIDMNALAPFQLDSASGQTLAEAFDAVAIALRNGDPVVAQDWFENQVGAACAANATCSTYPTVTDYLVDRLGIWFEFEDLWRLMNNSGGVNRLLFANGELPFSNTQALINNFTTDGGVSNFHAGFVSLRKRMSQGLTFDANYTFGHSLDVYGLNQEYTQFSHTNVFDKFVDYQRSLFDRRHVFNATAYYELPFGRGRRWSSESTVADKILGGWWISGIWTQASGLPMCVASASFAGNFGARNAFLCAIPTGPIPSSGVHRGVTGSGGVGDGGDVNMYSDPEAVFANFRTALISRDGRHGPDALSGLNRWNLDFSLGKRTTIAERYTIAFSFEFINIFNHMEFVDAAQTFNLDLQDSSQFGVLNSQFGGSGADRPAYRTIQFGLRFEF